MRERTAISGASAKKWRPSQESAPSRNRALRKAVVDLRECEDAVPLFQAGCIFCGGGCEDECHDLLGRLMDETDDTGMVRLRYSDLGKPSDVIAGLGIIGLLTGKSGAYRLDFEAILTRAAEARRSEAACEAAERAYERVMARDLKRYRRA